MANEIFDKLKSGINKGITTVGVTTTSTVEKTKLKANISNLTNEVKGLYLVAGEKIYSAWDSDNFNADSIITKQRFA
jgi:hypothetical protein